MSENESAASANDESTNRIAVPGDDYLEKSAVGDFLYQAGANVVGGVGAAGIIAGAAVAWDKVTGGDSEGGKHKAD